MPPTPRKSMLVGAIVAATLLVPATAYATHTFTDVPDEKFFAGPVEWAHDNEITTGTTATTFDPERSVTRGEAVTFLKRYDDNVVEPALAELTADIAALESQLASLVNGVAAYSGGDSHLSLTATATIVQTVSLTPPADGTVVVNASAHALRTTGAASLVRCSITEGTTVDESAIAATTVENSDYVGVIAATRGFTATEGQDLTVNLVCDAFTGTSDLDDAALTAIFAPS